MNPNQKTGERTLTRRLLLFGYLLFSLNGWLRLIGSITEWRVLVDSNIRPGPLYLLLTGLVWGAVSLIAFVWVIRHLPSYRLVGLSAALLIAALYWIDRLLVRNPAANLPNTVFALAFTILAIGYVVLALRLDAYLERFLVQKWKM